MKCKLFLYIHFTWITQARCSALASSSLSYKVQKISWLLKKIWLTTSVCFCWYIQGELSHVFIRYWHISPTKEAWPPSPLRNDILDTDRPQIERFLISENAILLIHQYHRHLILPFLHNKYATSNHTEHSKTKSSLLIK